MWNKRNSMTNPVATYDIRINANDYDFNTVKKLCNEIAAKWVFQKEQGNETGYLHWQCKVKLHKKKRLGDMIKLVHKGGITKCDISITSTNAKEKFNYVMKLDTRVDGPWSDQDQNIEDMPPELKNPKPYPFQDDIIEASQQEPDTRTINVLYDPDGGRGKSWLRKYLRWHKLATVVPPFARAEDMAQMVMCKPPAKTYIIDIPRKITFQQQEGLYGAIETLKEGYCYDKRHHFKDRQAPSPNIWVFTNNLPPMEHLSMDRWVIYTIDHKNRLCDYSAETVEYIKRRRDEMPQEQRTPKKICKPLIKD